MRRGVRGGAQAEQGAAGVGEGPPALAGRLPAGGSAKQELALLLAAADLPHQRVEHIVHEVAQGRRRLVEGAVHLRRQGLALLRAHLRTWALPCGARRTWAIAAPAACSDRLSPFAAKIKHQAARILSTLPWCGGAQAKPRTGTPDQPATNAQP